MKDFFIGLKQTIKQAGLIGNINSEGKAYILWGNVFGALLGWPITFYIIMCIATNVVGEYSIIEHIVNFKDTYIALFIITFPLRLIGICYLGTYKYIFKYIFRNKK